MDCARIYTDEYNYINLNEINFKLNGKTKGLLKSKLQKIQDEVPQYSTITLNLIKEKKDNYEYFCGELKISTYSSKFSTKASHFAIENLLIQLEKDIRDQIKEWKKDRFQKRLEQKLNLQKLTGGYV